MKKKKGYNKVPWTMLQIRVKKEWFQVYDEA